LTSLLKSCPVRRHQQRAIFFNDGGKTVRDVVRGSSSGGPGVVASWPLATNADLSSSLETWGQDGTFPFLRSLFDCGRAYGVSLRSGRAEALPYLVLISHIGSMGSNCAAPTALVCFLFLFPGLTSWANFGRAYGAAKGSK
jgi:hypothetical protein